MKAVSLTLALIALFREDTSRVSFLQEFVNRKDPAYAWSVSSTDGLSSLRLTSQEWKGGKWEHDLVRVDPPTAARSDAAIIEVTGWEPNSKDFALAQLMAQSSGLPVYVLFQVPNQPLWGREEDALIAFTVEKFLTGDGDDWPLLLPMVKSVKSAMDAIQESTEGATSRFVITGASKRGWTAWLSAAIEDARVVGIAPRVYDNLDIAAQLERQLEQWGGYSPMIRDYTDRGLQTVFESPKGKEIIQMVDPLAYLSGIHVPTLVLTGTNDPYWTVDSTQVYWDRMEMPKWALSVPNANHGLGDPARWAPSLGWFTRLVTSGSKLPHVSSRMSEDDSKWELSVACEPGPDSFKVWSATSADLHFETAVWRGDKSANLEVSEAKRSIHISGRRPRTFNQTVIVEFEFKDGNEVRRVTTPVYLVRKSLP